MHVLSTLTAAGPVGYASPHVEPDDTRERAVETHDCHPHDLAPAWSAQCAGEAGEHRVQSAREPVVRFQRRELAPLPAEYGELVGIEVL